MRWTDNTPYTYSDWVEKADMEPHKITFPDFQNYLVLPDMHFPKELKESCMTFQPHLTDEFNCTVMFLSNPYHPVWLSVPCNMTLQRMEIICEFHIDYTNDSTDTRDNFGISVGCGSSLHRESKECADDGWWYINANCLKPVPASYPASHQVRDFNLSPDITLLAQACESLNAATVGTSSVDFLPYHDYLTMLFRSTGTILLLPEPGQVTCGLVQSSGFDTARITVENNVLCETAMRVANAVICVQSAFQVHVQTCLPGHYRCEDGTCILAAYHCDGFPHCPDATDEVNCTVCSSSPKHSWVDCFSGCKQPYCHCSTHYFQCKAGGCVPWTVVCDCEKNCLDNSDEAWCSQALVANCGNETESRLKDHGSFHCDNNTSVAIELVNDFIADCHDSVVDEEMYINFTAGIQMQTSQTCSQDGIPCVDGFIACFPGTSLCVFERDETGRTTHCRHGNHLRNCYNFTCPTMFKCPHSYCVPLNVACDGRADCPNGEDEAVSQCKDGICQGLLKCSKDNVCVHPRYIAEGTAQCIRSRDDEALYQLVECLPPCHCKGLSVSCAGFELAKIPKFHFQVKALNLSQSLHAVRRFFLRFHNTNYLLSLDLSKNNLTDLLADTFKSLSHLLFLSLHGNHITQFEPGHFVGLNNLRELNILKNPLFSIATSTFSSLNSLPHLDMTNLRLTELLPCTFSGLSHCLSLSVARNMLVAVQADSLCGLRKLQYADFRENPILTLDLAFLKQAQFLKLLLMHNHEICCLIDTVDLCMPRVEMSSKFACKGMISSHLLRLAGWLVISLVIFLNGTALLLSVVEKKMSGDKLLTIGLYFSDLLSGLSVAIVLVMDGRFRGLYVALYSMHWRYSPQCVTAAFLSLMSTEMTLQCLLFIVAQRWFAVAFPFKVKDMQLKAPLGLSIACVGLLSFAISFFFFYSASFGKSSFAALNSQCSFLPIFEKERPFYAHLAFMLVNFTIICLIGLFSSMTVRALWRKENTLGQSKMATSRRLRLNSRAIVRVCLAPLYSTAMFVVSCCIFVLQWNGYELGEHLKWSLALLVQPLQGCVNPLLFIFITPRSAADVRTLLQHFNRH